MSFINAPWINRGLEVAALAAMCVTAPLLLSAVAHAEPDPAAPPLDVQAACESLEFGGVYVPTPDAQDGVARAQCQYIVEGYFYYDNYDNGAYTGTLVYRDGAKVPTEHPVMPGLMDVAGGKLPMVPFPGQF